MPDYKVANATSHFKAAVIYLYRSFAICTWSEPRDFSCLRHFIFLDLISYTSSSWQGSFIIIIRALSRCSVILDLRYVFTNFTWLWLRSCPIACCYRHRQSNFQQRKNCFGSDHCHTVGWLSCRVFGKLRARASCCCQWRTQLTYLTWNTSDAGRSHL